MALGKKRKGHVYHTHSIEGMSLDKTMRLLGEKLWEVLQAQHPHVYVSLLPADNNPKRYNCMVFWEDKEDVSEEKAVSNKKGDARKKRKNGNT